MVKGGPVGVVERFVLATDIFVQLQFPSCKREVKMHTGHRFSMAFKSYSKTARKMSAL